MSLNYCFNPTNCALRRRSQEKKRSRRRRSKPRKKQKTRSKPRKRRRTVRRKSKPRKRRRSKPSPPPPTPKKKRRRRRKRSTSKKKRRRRSQTKSYSRSIVEKPRSKVVTETTYETWVCDPDDGTCRLVRHDYSKGTADKIGRYQGPLIPANDANLLDLASGLDGATYCAVADGLGKMWVKCGTKDAKNCECDSDEEFDDEV